MSRRPRRNHSPAFKAKVALAHMLPGRMLLASAATLLRASLYPEQV